MITRSDIIILAVAGGLLAVAVSRTSFVSPDSRHATRVNRPNPEPSIQATNNSDNTLTNQPDTETPPSLAENQAVDVSTPSDKIEYRTHVVRSGEYLSLIAKKYDTTVEELKALNQLQSSVILVKQKLSIPNP